MENIHVKIDYDEAVEGKKDILTSEAAVLECIKKIKNINHLEKEEEKLKADVRKKLREVSILVTRIDKEMPEEHMPKMKTDSGKSIFQQKFSKSLDNELSDIQKKLKALE